MAIRWIWKAALALSCVLFVSYNWVFPPYVDETGLVHDQILTAAVAVFAALVAVAFFVIDRGCGIKPD